MIKKSSWAVLFCISWCLGTKPAFAIDCPKIPREVQEVVTNSDQAYLRSSPAINDKNLIARHARATRLIVPDPTPFADSKNCWYRVSAFDDSTNYWIPQVNLEDFCLAQASVLIEPLELEPPVRPTDNSDDALVLLSLFVLLGSSLGIMSFVSLLIVSTNQDKQLQVLNKQVFILRDKLREIDERLERIRPDVLYLKTYAKQGNGFSSEEKEVQTLDMVILSYFLQKEQVSLNDLLVHLNANGTANATRLLMQTRLQSLEIEGLITVIDRSERENPVYKMA